MNIYVITGENGMFYGAFKTKKHVLNHFNISRLELEKILKNYPHDMQAYCGEKFGKTMLIKETNIY